MTCLARTLAGKTEKAIYYTRERCFANKANPEYRAFIHKQSVREIESRGGTVPEWFQLPPPSPAKQASKDGSSVKKKPDEVLNAFTDSLNQYLEDGAALVEAVEEGLSEHFGVDLRREKSCMSFVHVSDVDDSDVESESEEDLASPEPQLQALVASLVGSQY